ncbi:signal peptidase I [Paramaledivibacter caminithermalis]|jgi:signal peptidase I|uniref:Signal peptidase I n=1 Tax=Paramaledivibacter caminithermalis (strain DSM 15212 / CIP 107654 / DViRD3) TaxID=1121301 RepID=A0A1M6NK29_PARC5|nr:signal peptidase I [Paramaledivibacter caminithermalis]SHJ96029.1 signal peptidase I [Paramaledivibacter caminithermalis DSM 15212]
MFKKALRYGLTTIIMIILIVPFILKPIKVKGNSMYPVLKDGDWVLVSKISYIFSKPRRGDIIVFDLPNLNRNKKYFIKRIIGLEKETIEIKFGKIYINNAILHECYGYSSISDSFYKRIIPIHNFFVLGDNRRISVDSRYEDIGFVDRSQIIGKIILEW